LEDLSITNGSFICNKIACVTLNYHLIELSFTISKNMFFS